MQEEQEAHFAVDRAHRRAARENKVSQCREWFRQAISVKCQEGTEARRTEPSTLYLYCVHHAAWANRGETFMIFL